MHLPPRAVPPGVPDYLVQTYWWAYVSPQAIRFFERPWLVNLILWGNYRSLEAAALDALGPDFSGETLQIACVYGDLSPRLARALPADGALTVVDVVPDQLANLERKLPRGHGVALGLGDSAALPLETGRFHRALLFFLLHEQPEAVRRRTLAEALRVLRPGGRLVIIDYHRPRPWHPLYWPMVAILKTLEPFALDLWRHPLEHWLPPEVRVRLSRRTRFGGLYQEVVLEKLA